MVPYWIDTTRLAETGNGDPPRVAIVPCPPGGHHLEAAALSLREQGITTLASLLCADEIRVLKLEAEGKTCREAGIDFWWLPVTDHSIPESMEEFRLVLDRLRGDLRAGKGVGAHCYAGIGRSCLLIACLLCLEGLTAEDALDRLSAARGLRVPDTWLQSEWVRHFAESLQEGKGPA
jgi:protein-tyrosine phosphatase